MSEALAASLHDFAIEVEGLGKQFGDHRAVDGLTMHIERGRVHGFIGPNGSGKTTAIRMICGLLEPSSGHVRVLGMQVPEQAEEVRTHVGYMTQRFSMYEDLTVLENLEFLGRIHGLGSARRRQRIEAVLDQFRLEALARHRVGPMSGGQKRRIALAAAILTEPELLILDEPTSEVDPNTRREMWRHFFGLAEAGTTILVSTHLMDEAERCHRLTIMNEGHRVADGEVQALKDELDATVLRIRGGEPTRWVDPLSAVEGVIAVNQVGLSLRVLTRRSLPEPESALAAQLPDEMQVERVPATVEDVFVLATHEGT